MKKIDLFFGVLIGLISTLIGCFIFIEFFTAYHFIDGVQVLKSQGLLGKVITLGAILNIIIFFTLLKFKKEIMARGVILATIILTIITLYI